MKGMKTEGGKHPCPYEEAYYILRGRGILTLDDEKFNVEPNTIAYIPCDTYHQLENMGNEDLQTLTIMLLHPKEGVNRVYDEGKRQWGTYLRLVKKKTAIKLEAFF